MAHKGVLFLDELPLFTRHSLEVMRQPIEEGVVRISRAAAAVAYPAEFILVAAMNPCPCGYFTDKARQCRCSPFEIQRYISKISGPLLDRIDIHVEVPRVAYRELKQGQSGADSAEIRAGVARARAVQAERLARSKVQVNARMNAVKPRTEPVWQRPVIPSRFPCAGGPPAPAGVPPPWPSPRG